MVLADSFLFQGVKHEVCEDYALHGEDYFVISDGCSNGGVRVDTDFGARLICKASEKHRRLFRSTPDLFLEETLRCADSNRKALELAPESLSATLFMGCWTPSAHRYFLCGDGFYGGRNRDGVWFINRIEFVPSAPDKPTINFYPSYILLDLELYTRYFQEKGGRYKVTTSIGKFGDGFETTEYIETLNKYAPYLIADFPSDKFDLTFSASDGLGAFTTLFKGGNKKYTVIVDYLKVMEVILDFVQYSSGFLRHQCTWCFKQNKNGTFPDRDWHNTDDVAIGVLYDPSNARTEA